MSNIIDLTFLGDLLDISGNDITITPSGNFNVAAPLDVTGSVTADGLTVESATVAEFTLKNTDSDVASGEYLGKLHFEGSDSSTGAAGVRAGIYAQYGSSFGYTSLDLLTSISGGSLKKGMTINGDGDISFYEDTGTNQSLFWDASTERLGIGTISPAVTLDVNGDSNTQLRLTASDSLGASIVNFGDQANAAQGRIIYSHINDSFSFKTNNVNDRLVIDSAGNVRIGVNPATTITGLTQTSLVVGSLTGGEIVAYRDDNAGVEGDFVGAFLIGNDDNSGTEDHFVGMYGKIVGGTGNSMSLNFASGLGNYENDTPQMVLDDSGRLTVFGDGVAEFRVGNIGPSNNSAIRVSRNDTSVTSGNPLGYLEFGGNDSTSNVDAAFAYVGAEASGAHTAGDNPTDLVFGTTVDNTAAPTERMRIDSQGRVGIKTPNPTSLLHIFDGQGGTDAQTDLLTLQTQRSDFGSGGSSILFFDTEAPPSTSGGNASSRGRIKAYTENADEFQTDFRFSLSDRSDSAITSISADTTTITVVHVASVGLGVEVGDYVTIQSTTNFNEDFEVTGVDSDTQFTIAATGYDAFAEETSGNIAKSETFDRMVITGTGNVGIGTNSPTGPLHVSGSGPTVAIKIDNTGTGGDTWRIWSTNDVASDGGGKLGFYNEDTATRAMTLDSSGNVGIGTAPEAWGVGVIGVDFGTHGSLVDGTNVILSRNAYYDGAWKYKTTDHASSYWQDGGGEHIWQTAASGTADAALTWSESMRIDSGGRLGINQTPLGNNFALQVTGLGGAINDARVMYLKGAGNQTTIGGTAPTLVLQNTNSTANNIVKLSFESASSGETVSINAINTDHSLFYGDLAFNTRGSDGYSEKMRIMANGNVGIGTDDPQRDAKLDVNILDETYTNAHSNLRLGSRSSSTDEAALTFATTGQALQGTIFSNYGYDNDVAYQENALRPSGYISFSNGLPNTGTGLIIFGGSQIGSTTLIEHAQFNPSGNLQFADGKGIDFSALTTPATTGTATGNVLNDYEEGTWTPTPAGSTTAGTFDVANKVQSGTYTKVGNLVHVSCIVYMTGFNGRGNFTITGLPFSIAGSSGIIPVQTNTPPWNDLSADNQLIHGYISGTTVSFRATSRLQSTSYETATCIVAGSVTVGYVRLTGTYEAA